MWSSNISCVCVCVCHPRRAGCSWFISHTYTSVLFSLVQGTDSKHSHTHTGSPSHTHTHNSSVLFCSAGSDELARSLLPSPPHLLVISVPMRLTGSICRRSSPDPSLPLFLHLPLFHATVLNFPRRRSDVIMYESSRRIEIS